MAHSRIFGTAAKLSAVGGIADPLSRSVSRLLLTPSGRGAVLLAR